MSGGLQEFECDAHQYNEREMSGFRHEIPYLVTGYKENVDVSYIQDKVRYKAQSNWSEPQTNELAFCENTCAERVVIRFKKTAEKVMAFNLLCVLSLVDH